MELGVDRAFHYHGVFRRYLALTAGCVGICGFMLLVATWLALRLTPPGVLTAWDLLVGLPKAQVPTVVLVLGGGALIAHCVSGAYCAFLQQRGRVHASEDEIVVTDWRGREGRLRWAEISELHYRPPGRKLRAMQWGFELRGPAGRLHIADGVSDAETLRDVIVGRANLTGKRETWWGVVYARPER